MIYGGCALVIAGLLIYIMIQRNHQKKMLDRIRRMLEGARSGKLPAEPVDESLVSAAENSMRQFLQENLRNGERLQEQKRIIQTLISDISHQTTTPLSNIMVYSQLLEEELTAGAQRQKAQTIREQAEKLDFLLKSLVKASRLETGIIKTVPVRCDLTELVGSAILQIAAKAEEKGIRLDIKQKEVAALCDPRWTEEACLNLLDNAVKYTGKGGRIKVTVTEYPMFAEIAVRDEGIGIREEEIPKIFARFFRGSNTNLEDGVGLGLYLARRIVESEGGYIKVTSRLGEGSCFSVFLPKEQPRGKDFRTVHDGTPA